MSAIAIIYLLLALLLGLIIGYFIGRNSCAQERETSHIVEKGSVGCQESGAHGASAEGGSAAAGELPVEEGGESEAPKFLPAPREGGKDNLTRIKGIGKKIEEKLNELGIFHFDQIAAWTAKEIAWIDQHLAFPGRVEREEWVEQAKKLAQGEETEFSKRVDAGEVPTSKTEG